MRCRYGQVSWQMGQFVLKNARRTGRPCPDSTTSFVERAPPSGVRNRAFGAAEPAGDSMRGVYPERRSQEASEKRRGVSSRRRTFPRERPPTRTDAPTLL